MIYKFLEISRNIFFTITFVCFALREQVHAFEVLKTAKTKQTISTWAKKSFGVYKATKIDVNGKHLLAVEGDSCSGLYCPVLYLYLFDNHQWGLIFQKKLYNGSDVIKITYLKDDASKELKVIQENGTILAELPFNKLSSFSSWK